MPPSTVAHPARSRSDRLEAFPRIAQSAAGSGGESCPYPNPNPMPSMTPIRCGLDCGLKCCKEFPRFATDML